MTGEGPFYRHQGCPASLRVLKSQELGHGKQIHIVYISVISVFGGLKEMILNLFWVIDRTENLKTARMYVASFAGWVFFFFCQAWGGCYRFSEPIHGSLGKFMD